MSQPWLSLIFGEMKIVLNIAQTHQTGEGKRGEVKGVSNLGRAAGFQHGAGINWPFPEVGSLVLSPCSCLVRLSLRLPRVAGSRWEMALLVAVASM